MLQWRPEPYKCSNPLTNAPGEDPLNSSRTPSFDMESDRFAIASPVKPRRRSAASVSVRSWLVISESGRSRTEQVGKYAVMRRTGILARDLRGLDELVWHPTAILVRKRAIVVCLEHVKAIITATDIMIPNPNDPLVRPFAREVEDRISYEFRAMPSPQNHSMALDMKDIGTGPTGDLLKEVHSKVLPFEFKALELCLESACRCLKYETSILEQEVCLALDALIFKFSTSNLECVRHIKNRVIAVLGRVQQVSHELENMLGNNIEMTEMCLTDKLMCEQMKEASSNFELDNDVLELDEERVEDSKRKAKTSDQILKPNNIEELETLLEAYFVQIKGTLDQLSTLRDDIDDTMDYINIKLDDRQNKLLNVGVKFGTAHLLLAAMILMTALFGVSPHIDIYNTGYKQYWEVTIGLVGAGVVLYFVFMVVYKRTGILV